jgi:S-adenosylmethionine-diacylglycerol 3-amino-3-carboxypropyl transferase
MYSEAATAADFRSLLRYGQCWEDADVLLEALDVRRGHTCLSIASAGDNTLSLLSREPARVIAIDLNPAQIAALELRVAAYKSLSHAELLELLGSRPSRQRGALYARCRTALSAQARAFWDARPAAVHTGIGAAGKFEAYLRLFRTAVLPLVHRRSTVSSLLEPRSREERRLFYDERWDTRAWRLLFRAFFSQPVLGRLGRDPSFFRYSNGSVAEHLSGRARHALAELDPSKNPYVWWILTGQHADTLPHALRPENFETIRANLDRLEWHCKPIEELTASDVGAPIDRANVSDIFEYLSPENTRAVLARVVELSRPGARIAYWNMIVHRRGAEYLPDRLRPLRALSERLFAEDKAFFYRDFVVEEVLW